MKKYPYYLSVLCITLILSIAGMGQAQDTAGIEQEGLHAVRLETGQNLKLEGVILDKEPGGLRVLFPGGLVYNVSITDETEIKERKTNPFRSAKNYSRDDLFVGLQVEVAGTGDSKGNLVAREIKMRQDDFETALSINARVEPVEDELKETRMRLEESEQNAHRLSGQVQEVTEASKSARTDAQNAQELADRAMSAAGSARTFAEESQAATNERISALDEYSVGSTAIIQFAAGSAELSEKAKSDLQALAGQMAMDKGYLVEVTGFASSDGSAEYNRRLSQMRADSVIRHMSETFGISIRRFITPVGYGENQPIADNRTHAGRVQNRRVEIRVLVSKGLTQSELSEKLAEGPDL